MGKSDRGPDMLDCLAYLRVIERQTGKRITVLLTPDTPGVGPVWCMTLLANSESLVSIGEGKGIAVESYWPNKRQKEFCSALYASLALLDGEIGRAVFQEVLDIK